MKEHFKRTFLLLLFKVNVSSVKLLAVIKYFLSPLASLILNNIITPGRLTVTVHFNPNKVKCSADFNCTLLRALFWKFLVRC